MTTRLSFELHRGGVARTCAVEIERVIVAGWTGRNRTDVDRHIAELQEIGVCPPPAVPVFYRVAPSLLTHDARITVVGADTSGEVEFYLLALPEGHYVGVGSDHTDRRVETYDITVSKQMCAKPVSRAAWFLADLRERWDSLVVESHATRNGERRLYQRGTLDALLLPDTLVQRYAGAPALAPGTLMFGGTVPVVGGVAGGERFEISLSDPRSGGRLEHTYDVEVVPPFEAR